MKKIFMLTLVYVLLLTGCSNKPATQTKNSGDNSKPATISEDSKAVAADVSSDTLKADDSADQSSASGKDVIEIKEKMFIAQTNDIYLNSKEYLGKTIRYQGIFSVYYWDETDLTYYSVIRYGPGCCENDANAGFEVIWDGDYPDQNDWVEATGVLESYIENGTEYLRLRLSSLSVLPTRGAENVYQ